MPRYGYNGRAGVGRSGHTPSAEEPSTVVRKKTPLHHLHQKVGVSIRVMSVNLGMFYAKRWRGWESVREERERQRVIPQNATKNMNYKFVWVRSIPLPVAGPLDLVSML